MLGDDQGPEIKNFYLQGLVTATQAATSDDQRRLRARDWQLVPATSPSSVRCGDDDDDDYQHQLPLDDYDGDKKRKRMHDIETTRKRNHSTSQQLLSRHLRCFMMMTLFLLLDNDNFIAGSCCK